MSISLDKKYLTRGRNEVRNLHRAPDGWAGKWPWRGEVADGGGWKQRTWTDSGLAYDDNEEDNDDLIEICEPREWSLYVTRNGSAYVVADGFLGTDGEHVRVREVVKAGGEES